MNYRHAYHAGNFADVWKHAVLVELLHRLRSKPAPFTVLDTHAGIGRYDLAASEAARTGEWRDGIGRLRATPPAEAADYLAAVERMNEGAEFSRYPGSPELVRGLLRDDDRLILCELHPEDADTLRAAYGRDRKIAVHHRDGYEAIGALTPPPPPAPRRGLVLIDPPYEAADEVQQIGRTLKTLWLRWPTAQLALWYPIKDRAQVWALHEAALQAGWTKLLIAELSVAPEDGRQLVGSGMLLGNPPFQIEERLERLGRAVQPILDRGGGHVRVETLASA